MHPFIEGQILHPKGEESLGLSEKGEKEKEGDAES